MNRICWWLVDIAGRMLERFDREVVRGDIAESGGTAAHALRDVLGLVVRRQAALWKGWRPWLALVGLAGMAGMALRLIDMVLGTALTFQLRTWWHYGVRYEDGLTPFEEIALLVCMFLAMCLWSWASGLVLGLLSGRTIWLTAPLFFLIVTFPPFRFSHLLFRGDELVFHSHRRILLLILSAVLPLQLLVSFLLPAAWGVRQGLLRRMPSVRQTFTLAVAITLLILPALANLAQGGWRFAAISLSLCALVSWPIGYMATIARRNRDRHGAVH
jgi:hypothetical protein